MDRRYFVILGALITQFMVIGLFFIYSLLIKELELEFGWSRTILSIGASIAGLLMGGYAILGGRLSDLFGPRVVLTGSGLLYGLGYASISLISEPWHLYVICGLFLGLGMGTHDVVTLGAVARWFPNRKGLMTGVVKSGTAAGQVILPPVAAILIATYGWAHTIQIMGIGAALLLVIAAQFMRVPPKSKTGGAPLAQGLPFAQVKRTRSFWILCAMQFLFFPALMTVPLHIAVHGMDLGMPQTTAAGLLSIVGASSVVGRLSIGAFADRLGGRIAYLLCLAPMTTALVLLIFVRDHRLIFALMALYGAAHGGLFVVVAPTIAELFGTRAHGSIFGVIVFFGTTGGAIGPVFAGQVFDRTGGYDIAFAGLASMIATALILTCFLPRRIAKPAEGLS
ncbi:MAG: MFS transporter [Rhizobiaceae bacterium]